MFNKSPRENCNQSYLAITDVVIKVCKTRKPKQKGNQSMKLEINVPVSGLDLASLLEGEQGLFLCQNRGQNYITVAKSGHSIAFGPTPIGKPILEQVPTASGPEPWFVTKISNSTELAEFRGSFREGTFREGR
jgi:hypothetical protein